MYGENQEKPWENKPIMRSASDKQVRYLNILVVKNLGHQHRKLYLKLFYKVDSSKELTVNQASEIIEKFVEENPMREKHKALALHKIYRELGQKELFPCDWIKE